MTEYITEHYFDGESMAIHQEQREEIVRCRDCKWCMAYWQATYCDYMAHSVELDGFCAWASRKVDECKTSR